MNQRSRSCIAVAVSAAMLAGCATGPVPYWERPQVQRSEDPRSFAYARRYADAMKDSYNRAIQTEVMTNGQVGTALIVLGGAVAALAGFKAHRDTILGATLLGGTAYGVANWNSAKARLPYYQKGIESVECAKKALLPLDATPAEVRSLDAALAALSASKPKVETSLVATRGMLEALKARNLRKDLADSADALVQLADDGLKNADKTLKAGEQLKKRRSNAGQQLIDFVDATNTAVQGKGLATVPPLSATTSIISNIPTWGAAPAAPSPKADTQSLASKAALTSSDEARLQQQVKELKDAYEAMQKDVNRVGEHVDPAKLSDIDTALKTCDMSSTSAALSTVPDMLTFSGAASEPQTIFVSGGEKQYVGSAGDNFSVVTQDSSLIVTTKQAVKAGTYILLIKDSSKPTPQERPVQITVTGKGTPPAEEDKKTTPKASTPDDIATKLKNLGGQKLNDDKVKVTVTDASADKATGVVTAKVSCEPAKPDPKLKREAVRAKLVEALGDDGKSFVADDPKKITVDSSPSPDCFEADAQSLRGKARNRRGGR